MTFGQRLKELRTEKRLTQEELGNIINVKKATVSLYEKGQREPGQAALIRLASYFNVSVDYLLGKENKTDPKPTPDLIVADQNIRVYGQIHAGAPSFAEQNVIGSIPVTQKFINDYGSKNLFALQIKGDSMSRVIPDSYIGVFAKGIHIETNDIVAVLIDGDDATIKRYHETSKVVMFEPDSYNPTYQPIIFQKAGEQDFEILGKFLYATSMPI